MSEKIKPEKRKSLFWKFIVFRRNNYSKRFKKRIKNTNPTIIASNCIGGVIYHELGLQFKSPTINLYFEEEYVTFLENLKGFLSVEPVEIKPEGYDFPVGELRYNGQKVTLFFTHYKTFQEAFDKWEERKKRVDFDNIFVIWEVAKKAGPDKDLLDRFLALPYEHKVLITGNECPAENKEIFKIKLYDKKYYPGKILGHRLRHLSPKRYLYQFDFVEFLNTGKIKKS